MTDPEITRKIEFDSGHRVLGHEGKCKHLHGHRYVAEITVRAKQTLDDLGRVVDFSVMKNLIGKWVDDNWDHNIILHPDDPLAKLYSIGDVTDQVKLLTVHSRRDIFNEKAPYIMPKEKPNPTAENLVWALACVSNYLLEEAECGVYLTRIRLYETPNCWADYILKK